MAGVVVIGLACRFPGNVNDGEGLWDILKNGKHCWTETPEDRFQETGFLHLSQDHLAGHNHRGGHFLAQNVAAFDAAFFGIPAKEAEAMDPQQRLILETTYEAIENSGMAFHTLRGSKTGVYVAKFPNDYENNLSKDAADLPRYYLTGIGHSMLANRVSHFFDLRGPSMTIDTACSGSLVALNQACLSLRARESDMAIVSGVNLILSPEYMLGLSNLHMLNDQGTSFSFDKRGSGYGRGEGCAAVVLKRIDTMQPWDPVRALIRGTIVNQDGRTPSITSPNQESQECLQRALYNSVGVQPNEIDYVEAHGTGTLAGDVTEIAAIANVYNSAERKTNLLVGSIKSNIGHLEACSGLAGLIKSILILEKQIVPPNANFESPKDELCLLQRNIQIPTEPEYRTIKRVALNSFGYGGTNAHVLLEKGSPGCSSADHSLNCADHPSCQCVTVSEDHDENPWQLVPITARTRQSLVQYGRRLHEYLALHQGTICLKDLSATLCHHRHSFEWRKCFVVRQAGELIEALKYENLECSINNSLQRSPRIVFVFAGQGSSLASESFELLKYFSRFRKSISDSQQYLKQCGATWNLHDEIFRDDATTKLRWSEIAQPGTTALQIALVDVMHELGIIPEKVIGHSSGEIAAAYSVGALSHFDAIKIAFSRGFVSENSFKGHGIKTVMLVVELAPQRLKQHIERYDDLVIACVNSPTNTTLSGPVESISALKAYLNTTGIFSRVLDVDVGYHSRYIEPAAKSFEDAISDIRSSCSSSEIEFFSTVTAQKKTFGFGPKYWVQNLKSQVRYHDALVSLMKNHQGHKGTEEQDCSNLPIIEIGPHATLSKPSKQTADGAEIRTQCSFHSALRFSHPSRFSIMKLVCELLEAGADVNLKVMRHLALHESYKILTNLPNYVWDHSSTYWHESRFSQNFRFHKFPYHDLLGMRISSSDSIEPTWKLTLSLEADPWLRDHKVNGSIVFPGSGYICAVIEAIRQEEEILDVARTPIIICFKNVNFRKALIIPPDAKIEVQIKLKKMRSYTNMESCRCHRFSVYALGVDRSWSLHCNGSVSLSDRKNDMLGPLQPAEEKSLMAFYENQDRTLSKKDLYKILAKNGNHYGETFASNEYVTFGEEPHAQSKVIVPDIASTVPGKRLMPHIVHPTTLDAVFHPSIALYNRVNYSDTVMPTHVDEIIVSSDILTAPDSELHVHTNITVEAPRIVSANLEVNDGKNRPSSSSKLQVRNLKLHGLGKKVNAAADELSTNFQFQWAPNVDFLRSSLISTATARSDPAGTGKNITALNDAALIFIARAVSRCESSDRIQTLGHLSHWLNWMKRELSHQESRLNDLNQTTTLTILEDMGIEGKMLNVIGNALASILTEESTPLEVMTRDGLLYELYNDESSSRCYKHALQYLTYLSFKSSHMSVLEIGGGTAAATKALLPAFGPPNMSIIKSYTFTDISSSFFDHASVDLEQWSHLMIFRKLDIEASAEEQGFQDGSYDLIIASNVLHATKYIGNTLRNVRNMLRPGGKLVLIEITCPQPYLNVSFGGLPGWWLGLNDGRCDGPVLSKSRWNEELRACSFNGTEIVVDDVEGSAQVSTFMASTAVPTEDFCTFTIQVIDDTPNNTGMDFYDALRNTSPSEVYRFSMTTWQFLEICPERIYIIMESVNEPILSRLTQRSFDGLKALLQGARNVLWITLNRDSGTHAPGMGLVTGLARSAQAENQDLKFLILHVQDDSESLSKLSTTVNKIIGLSFRDSILRDEHMEREYLFKDGVLHILRLKPFNEVNGMITKLTNEFNHVNMPFKQSDKKLELLFDSQSSPNIPILFEDREEKSHLGIEEIEVNVEAIGINSGYSFALEGRLSPCSITLECSGVVKSIGTCVKSVRPGDRICAWADTAISNCVRLNVADVAPVPDSIPFEISASLPSDLTTAWYCLQSLVNVTQGSSVLVVNALQRPGQALISTALAFECEVFATAGSLNERNILTKDFGLTASHLLSSDDPLIASKLKERTRGQGALIVVNCMPPKDSESLSDCVRPYGVFIQLETQGPSERERLNEIRIPHNTSYISFNVSNYRSARPLQARKAFQGAMRLLQTQTWTTKQRIACFDIAEIEEAIRAESSENVGNVVVRATSTSCIKARISRHMQLQLKSNCTYVVAGGLGDLGQHVCHLLVNRGAEHIVVLNRRTVDDEAASRFREDISSTSSICRVYFISCDISSTAQVKRASSTMADLNLPEVKGIVQATKELQDRTLSRMTLEDFNVPLKSKYYGTLNLINIFDSSAKPGLDFFFMLSATAGIIGSRGSANYASGSTFMDALASQKPKSSTHYVALDVGFVEEAAPIEKARMKNLREQGLKPTKMKELLALFEIAMSHQAHEIECRQIISGLDADSLSRATSANSTLQNPIFNQMRSFEVRTTSQIYSEKKSFKEIACDSVNLVEIHQAALKLIVTKVSELIAATARIDAVSSPMDIGLDSLSVIQLKDWIKGEFGANLSTAQIFAQSNLQDLVNKVISASEAMIHAHAPIEDISYRQLGEFTEPRDLGQENSSSPNNLPHQPLPSLDHSLQQLLNSRQCLIPADEYHRFAKVTEDFAAGPGRKLQKRLQAREEDPIIDNWQVQPYADRIYLSRRDPIYPNTIFFGAHLLSPMISQTQARRAALLSAAAFTFKQRHERNDIEPDSVNGEPICMDTWKWLFNSCREPNPGCDQMRRYPRNNHCAVLRHGHIFRLDLLNPDGTPVSVCDLETAFVFVISSTEDIIPSAATLTADNREDWSLIRKNLKLESEENSMAIDMLEKAVVVICLDDGSPTTPSERCNQFFLGDPSNRWSDKTFQFVVCENGTSAFIGEHSMLDGLSIRRLNQFLTEAIFSDGGSIQGIDDRASDCNKQKWVSHDAPNLATEYTISLNPTYEARVNSIRNSFAKGIEPIEIKHIDLELGDTFFQERKVSTKTGFQILIQLASRFFYGYQPCSWETVSLARFLKGRVDWIQAIQEPMKNFCDTASAMCSSDNTCSAHQENSAREQEKCQKLFFEAAIAYTNQRTRIGLGMGFKAHLHTLWALAPSCPESQIFFEDDQWVASSVASMKEVKNDSLEDIKVQEICFFMPRPECIYMHHDIHEESCHFLVQTWPGLSERLCQCLEKARGLLVDILQECQ